MAIIEMKVPVIGESVTEVTLSEWLVKDGDIVKLDEAICEFESDKATLEFPAEAAGKISFVASEGDDLEIGALVAKIDTSVADGSSSGGDASLSEPAKDASKAQETKELDAEVKVEERQEVTESTSNDRPSGPDAAPGYAAGHPSPAAAKIIQENGLSNVQGTGVGGRVTKEDAQNAANNKANAPAPQAPAAASATSAFGGDFSRGSNRKRMSRMRRTIARNLVAAKNETAMLTTFNEADMSAIFKLRKAYQEDFVNKYGVKLGFMSIFAKACAKALMEKPDVNAYIDTDTNEIIYHDYVDISFAISTPNGLVVPPIRNIESMNFAEIELKLKGLAAKARDGKLTMDEMTGGTFTISNGGVFGSMLSTPILNPPQSAILGMHNIIQRPVAVDGEVQIRPMMYLALSYDHRIIDGSTSVGFLVRVKELLEDPAKLLLDV